MKRRILLVTFLLIFLVILVAVLINNKKEKQNQVCFKNTSWDNFSSLVQNYNCFTVELAKTPEERSRGLMSRENLDLDKGMLFIFDEEREYSFWMKNTLISLDIIWINKDKEVVFIDEDAQPCKEYFCPPITPGKNAKYVLEVNGGTSEKIGLKIGDKIILEIK